MTVLTLAVLGPGTVAAAPIRECGNYDGVRFTFEDIQGAGVSNITTRVVGCRTARGLVRRYWHRYSDFCGRGPRCRITGWDCRTRSLGVEYADTRCTRPGGRVVRFQHGA